MLDIEDDILSEVIGCEGYHKRAPEFGERAYIAEGKEVDVVYWSEGNGWCLIMQVISKNCGECLKKAINFYKKLEEAIEEHYDEDGFRVS